MTGGLDGEVVAVVVFEPAEGRREELVAAVERGARRSLLDAGCLVSSLHDGDAGELVLIEKWASRDQLSEHLSSPLIAELLESYRGLLAAPPVPRIMAPRPLAPPRATAASTRRARRPAPSGTPPEDR